MQDSAEQKKKTQPLFIQRLSNRLQLWKLTLNSHLNHLAFVCQTVCVYYQAKHSMGHKLLFGRLQILFNTMVFRKTHMVISFRINQVIKVSSFQTIHHSLNYCPLSKSFQHFPKCNKLQHIYNTTVRLKQTVCVCVVPAVAVLSPFVLCRCRM